ncbi:MAG TPA: hypothetical protein VFE32_15370 [Puia sp.]|jgi:hypothetical protein|nr:hypothetical protein [Puia sp.]
MKYLSPTSLFGGILVPPLDKKAIQLGRKKLLAELELAGGDTVDINGKTYDRNEIISYFEELLSENTLDYHNIVSNDKVLLGFLREVQIEPGTRFARQAIYEDPAFIRWISPYFSQSFWQLIHESFVNSDDLMMATLLNNPLLMTVVDEEKIWTDIARLIQGEIDLLEHYFTSNRRQVAKWRDDKAMPSTAVADIMGYDHIRLLRLLPETRFAELRNKYAFAMMQASIVTFNRHHGKRDATETWITNAETLAVSGELKSQISDKLDEFRRIRKKKRPVNFRVIVIIVIAINAMRLITGNMGGSSNSYDVKDAPVIFTKPPNDSLARRLADTIERLNHSVAPRVSPSTPSR